MSLKKSNKTTEEILVDARKLNLENVHELTSMKAHGKVLGMDTFSWMNPELKSLVSAIESFPFSIVWLAPYHQYQAGQELSIALHEKLDTLIVYDTKTNVMDSETMSNIKTILCVNDFEAALQYIKEKEQKKMIFLFTTEGNGTNDYKTQFNHWIKELK